MAKPKDCVTLEKSAEIGWEYVVEGYDGLSCSGWSDGGKAQARKEALSHIAQKRTRLGAAV